MRLIELIISVVLLTPLAVLLDSPRAAAAVFELRPGVIVDTGEREAYLMNPHGGIEAIALTSGKVLWSTTAAAKPLFLLNRRLLAQGESGGHVMPIAMLDTKRDGQVTFKTSLPLPAGVTPSIDQGLGSSFFTRARIDDGIATIRWSFTETSVTGIFQPGPPAERRQDGGFRINLRTGRVEALTAKLVKEQTGPLDQSLPTRLRAVEKTLQTRPRRAGEFFFATQSQAVGRIVLKRWRADNGEELADVALPKGTIATSPSADGLMVAAIRPAGADAVGRQNYLWSIYSLDSGSRVGEIRMPTSAAPFFLWHSALVYESGPFALRSGDKWLTEPLNLRAVDVTTGSQLWKRPLRDTTYRSPTPPFTVGRPGLHFGFYAD